jgi:hypothetical protein
MPPEPGLTALRFLAYTALLYASFAHNVFWVPDGVFSYQDGFRSGYTGPTPTW